MRYLFIIQGEGRGHLTQAMTLERMLSKHGHEVVGMLVGKSASRKLPAFFLDGVKAPVHCFDTVNFVPSFKDKRPSIFRSFFYNMSISFKFHDSIRLISKTIKTCGADVIVNFYESLGSIGYARSRSKKPMVCIAHQFLLLHKDLHISELGYEGHLGLNLFTRAIGAQASKILALSFRKMPDEPKLHMKVVPPLLRPQVVSLRSPQGDDPVVRDGGYILGYMLNAGFSEEVMKWHRAHPGVPMHFFWDNASEGPVKKVDDTLSFYYLDDNEFIRQMAGCRAYASTAGFESICEAMYLGKPLMMVPTHIEQKCNAFDATKDIHTAPDGRRGRAAVASNRFDMSVLLDFAENGYAPDPDFQDWVRSAEEVILHELENF
ncbi:MAG: glycosyltransferase family protein [Candidatus Cryptobacteroides sp.]